jgi:DNA topoisomerase-3
MKLIIAEKPSLGRAIAGFIGSVKGGDGHIVCKNETVVTWAFGHLFEQATPDDYGFKRWDLKDLPIIPAQWKELPRKDAKKQLKIIGDLLKKADMVIHAGDPDREGQAIIDDILRHFKYKGRVQRLWLAALDDDSIKKAFAALKDNTAYKSLYDAAKARSKADWLVGMNGTRYYTLKSNQPGVKSVGRVQTPTLAMVVERDLRIERFKPVDYYNIKAVFDAGFSADWQPKDKIDEDGRCLDKAYAEAVAKRIKGKTGIIVKYDKQRKKEAPPLPHSLSSLQKEASSKYGFSAQKVLDLAQSLYETHKATTYPRTDCRYLPVAQHADAKKILTAIGAKNVDPARRHAAFDDKKITAHHAIIPTGVKPAKLTADEQKLYDLICTSYAQLFMPDHVYDAVKITVDIDGETFTATGKTVVEQGWKETAKETTLPTLKSGDKTVCTDAAVEAKKTQPPKRFTDGTLVEAMANIHTIIEDDAAKRILKENAGIGTEATRAGIIENLVKRGFLERKNGAIVSTPKGRALVQSLPDDVKSPVLTAQFETALSDVATGKAAADKFIRSIEQFVKALVR